MSLILRSPLVAWRDCGDCQKHHYDEKTGKRREYRGLPIVRPKGTNPPCRIREDGCPKGTPENQKSLSSKNMRAYHHYLECRAVNQFPGDPIVRRNAAIIRQVEDAARDDRFEMALVTSRLR